MHGRRISLRAGRLALALLAAAIAASAAGPREAGGAAAHSAAADSVLPGRAVVELATEPMPPLTETPASRWRRQREQSLEVLERVADRNDLDVVGRIPETGQLSLALAGETVAELQDRLSADPRVVSVRPDRAVELRIAPNDPAFTSLEPSLANTDFRQWYLSKLFAPQAWDLSRGSGVEVAVIDVGTDVSHPDLAGQISGALDCVGFCGGSNVFSSDGHGTHVAGLACATTNNGIGMASAGWGCKLFPIQIGSSCGDAAAAIVAAANRGSKVINMSFGGCDASLNNELQYALGAGSVLVAAGDNEPNPDPATNHPAQWIQPVGTGAQASFNRGLVVGAATHSGARASFSQNNSGITVAGFGGATNAIGGQQGILSTWPNVSCSPNCRTSVAGDSRYAYLQGTSMATPQVAGVAALMRSVSPSLSALDTATLIRLTASNCGTYGSDGLGWGIVNAYRAVAAAAPGDILAPSSKVKRGRGKLRVKSRDADEHRACTGIEVKASGVKKVILFVSVNGGEYRKLGRVKGKSERFRGKAGKRYRFYSIAIDEAGNREAAPAEADAKLNLKKKRRR